MQRIAQVCQHQLILVFFGVALGLGVPGVRRPPFTDPTESTDP